MAAREDLQLVGVTALLIASKYEDIEAPELGDIIYVTDDNCSMQDVKAMEIKILKAVNYNLGWPVPIQFLRRLSNGRVSHSNNTNKSLADYSHPSPPDDARDPHNG